MSTRDDAWDPGTPCWVDLMTTDRAAAWEFYRTVFGWKIVDTGEDFGHYGMAEVEGRPVAGLGGIPPGNPMPPAWTTYIASADADATAAAVTDHGGTILMAPMHVADQGRMCVAQDPTGAVFGVWQPGAMFGFGVADQPGSVVWNECRTRDTGAARAFYSSVFGYTYTVMDDAEDYRTIDGAGPGGTVGGIGRLDAGLPEQVPAHWMTYFMVADADTTAAAVTAGGGAVQMGPFDSPVGRLAVLTDPQGAAFAIMAAPADGPQAQQA